MSRDKEQHFEHDWVIEEASKLKIYSLVAFRCNKASNFAYRRKNDISSFKIQVSIHRYTVEWIIYGCPDILKK